MAGRPDVAGPQIARKNLKPQSRGKVGNQLIGPRFKPKRPARGEASLTQNGPATHEDNFVSAPVRTVYRVRSQSASGKLNHVRGSQSVATV